MPEPHPPSSDVPVLRMEYLRLERLVSSKGTVGTYVVLDSYNVRVLRMLSGRQVWIDLVNPTEPTYRVRIDILLRLLRAGPDRSEWFLPVSKTSPLLQLR